LIGWYAASCEALDAFELILLETTSKACDVTDRDETSGVNVIITGLNIRK
jgi:hypothetical protein